MKRVICFVAALAVITVAALPVQAGPRHHHGHHVAEGILIGAGIVAIGSAIVHGLARPPLYPPGPPPLVRPPVVRPPYWAGPPAGPCRIERVWVRTISENRWVPGHYSPGGAWVPGHYENVPVRGGHWENRRVCGP